MSTKMLVRYAGIGGLFKGYRIFTDLMDFEDKFLDYKYKIFQSISGEKYHSIGKTDSFQYNEDYGYWRGERTDIVVMGIEKQPILIKGTLEIEGDYDKVRLFNLTIGDIKKVNIADHIYGVSGNYILEDWKENQKNMENRSIEIVQKIGNEEEKYQSFKEMRNHFEFEEIGSGEALILRRYLGRKFNYFPF